MSTLTKDMVLDRTRLLAGITRREMAAVAGLYETSETTASYVEAAVLAGLLNDEFDTSGMEDSFCVDCGHDPCVAEYHRFPTPGLCESTPRSLSVGRVAYPIQVAGHALTGQAEQVYSAMSPMVHLLDAVASINEKSTGPLALRYLVKIRDNMRRVVAE